MALPFEGINDLFGNLTFDLDLFIWLFSIIIMITIYAVAIYHFYRYIARRDVFKPSERKHSKAIGFLKYFFLFPFVAMLFFIGFSVIFIFLTESYEIIEIMYVAFAVIIAIRITAYYTEDLSKDVAKMLPFAILGIFLIDSSYFSMDTVNERINALILPENINAIIQFLILIILVEWILRIALNVKRAIFKKKAERILLDEQT
jgi:hypothetical protein